MPHRARTCLSLSGGVASASILLLCLLVAVLSVTVNGSSVPSPTVALVSVEPLSTTFPVRLRLWGNFSNGWAVRFAKNTSACDASLSFTGGLAANNIPNSTISNIVRWSLHDSPQSWVVDLHVTRAENNAMICWSNDTGVTWWPAQTAQHASTFRIWQKVPTAVAVPQTVTAGALMRVLVFGALPRRTRAVLVQNISSCSGTSPRGVVTPVATYHREGFEFRVMKPHHTLFLCMATAPTFTSWSIIPFDPQNELVFHQGTQQIPTGNYAAAYITVYPSAVRFRRGVVNCTTAIAGARLYCTLEVFNRTALSISPSTVSISLITDGGSVTECPTPPLHAESATKLSFVFTPQRSGPDGTLQFYYLGTPLLLVPANSTVEYYTNALQISGFANVTVYQRTVIPWYTQDSSVMKFPVLPTFTYLQVYHATNLLNLSLFNVSSPWVTQYGVYQFAGRLNGTANGDMEAVTLNASQAGTIVQTAVLPSLAERCRLTVHFYLLGIHLVSEQTVFIGRVRVVSNTGDVLVQLELYNYLRQIIVTGLGVFGGRRTADVYTTEQLVREFSVLSLYTSVTVELSIDSTVVPQLYFLEPQLTCAVGAQTARTDLHDIQALMRIYHTVGSSSSLPNWKNGAAFNGDPCTNHWVGIQCRHMRVVGLLLNDMGLSGSFPPVRELTMLEEIYVSRNTLVGTFPVNNTRLRVVDVSHNLLTSLNLLNGAFDFEQHLCLRRLQASSNRIASFPDSVTSMTQIQEIDLSVNEMFGSVPSNWTALTTLNSLHLHTNHLTGSLPQHIPPLVTSMDFSANRFSGSIPATWGPSLTNVRFLDLSKNELNGTIPWNLAQDRVGYDAVMRMEDNYLTGVVPRLSLKLLDIRNNFFSCPMLRPELDTNTSEMNRIVNWGVWDWCDYQSAAAGY